MSLTYLELKEVLSGWKPNVAVENNLTPEFQLPTELEHGLFTTNIAFLLAKSLRQNPNQIAQDLKADLDVFLVSKQLPLESVQVGPYLNLKLKSEFFTNLIIAKTLVNEKQNSLNKENKTVLLDYVSPNVAKPLHAGHIRNANLGESLRRLFTLKYDKVITECYWGDWGVQFGILIWAWKRFEELKTFEVTINGELETISLQDLERSPLETMVRVYVWGNQQKENVQNFEKIVREEFLALEQGDKRNRELWQMFLDYSKEEIRKDLSLLNLPPFDLQQGESYYEAEFEPLQKYLESNQVWASEEKARFIDLEELSQNWVGISDERRKQVKSYGRCYLISSTGYTSYAFRDISARLSWIRDVNADLMITVTGNEQKHHFDQFIAIAEYLSSLESFQQIYGQKISSKLKLENLIHIPYGFLTLPDGKMSTRKGNIITANDVISKIVDEAKRVILNKNPENTDKIDQKSLIIGIAALKWFDLNRDSVNDIILDVPKILQFEGNTGVYQLYTYARLRSILRKDSNEKLNLKNENDSNLLNQAELLIIQQMYTLPETLEKAVSSYKPHLICNHLYSLCDKINSWYNSTPILKEENFNRKALLLSLITQITEHLEFTLKLLAIDVLEEI